MKNKPLFTFIVILFMLSGCLSRSSVNETSTKSVPSSTIAPPIVTSTAIFSPTSTATSEPTQTVTLTPPVVLEPGQVEEYINRSLLEEPVECDVPCFWGILPGETTFGEAKNIFYRLRLDLIFVAARGNKEYYGVIYDTDDSPHIVADFTIQENIVKNISVFITSKPKVSSSREWIAYSPRTLIEKYGAPSKVNFVLDWGPESFFEMDMHFDQYNLIVEYIVYGYMENSFPRVCPLNIPFRSISLWMGKDHSYPAGDVVLLEKGTSLTLEDFSNLLTGDANKACFTLKEEAFQ